MRTLTAMIAAAALATAAVPAAPAAASPGEKEVIAHRGASGYLPEHTLAAKAAAYAMGADYLEQDVVLTKDGVPIVLHDIHLGTTTNVEQVFPDRHRSDGKYYAIDFTLKEIKQLTVHERTTGAGTVTPDYATRFPVGQSSFKVPTLAEEIEMIQGMNESTGNSVGIYPEIKDPSFHREEGWDISAIVLKTLAKYGYTDKDDRFYLQCFDWKEVQRIRNELGFEGKLVQLLAENSWSVASHINWDKVNTVKGLKKVKAVADAVGPWHKQLATGMKNGKVQTTDLYKAIERVGLDIHAYTFRADNVIGWTDSFNEQLDVYYNKLGVEGVFTDHPDEVVSFLHEQ